MTVRYLVFVVAYGVLVCNNICVVQCADQCKTHAECLIYLPYCCGGYSSFGSKDRSCTHSSCLYSYCSSDSDCGDPLMCCRSNKCVNKGCSGCTSNTDCYSTHVCCKKTFPLGQTVCAANCISQTCNSNDDCAGRSECCRSGKCVKTGCSDKCTSNSECNLDQYCCKKKSSYWGDSCAQSCVGEICRIDDDCGSRNECCISNKCVDRGCSGCTTNANCSSGHYCCKKRQWYVGEFSECSAHCIGKSCSTSNDCGGPGETCDSDNRCAINQNIALPRTASPALNSNTASSSNTASNSLPSWLIAVITKQIQNQQPNTQFRSLNNPTAFQNHPQSGSNVVQQSRNPSHYPQGFQYGAQATPNQGLVTQTPAKSSQQGNENHGFHINPSPNHTDPGHHATVSSYPAQNDNEVHQNHNQLHDLVYHTFKSPEATKDAQFQDSSGQQIYPQNAPHQGYDYHHHPPYNPQYQGNP
ncbi:Hypothetical predicted protein [Paramuricea clavata]|uniref:Uncharacterized protein n=1 Tax=Paramuricea clavata TaxID=317549 RepID=A0A7D9ECI3_PARCT|nr:Hypothetical predicted protein [Paramuricea clavata]